MNNKTLLEKADLQIGNLKADGGYLHPAQAVKFMRVMVDQPTILRDARVVPMKAPKQNVEKVRFGSRILRAGQEGTELVAGDRSKPDTGSVELDAELFKAEIDLTDETLEDNIERGSFANTINQLIAERVAIDSEEVSIQGDTTNADPFLASFDGALKQSDANIVLGAGITDRTLFFQMLKSMPSEFRRDKRAMRFYVSVNMELDYRESLSARATDLGDKFVSENASSTPAGVPLIDCPTMPDGFGLLSNPKNLNVGIWRKIKMETDRDVRKGVLIVVVSLRMHAKWSVKQATVKTTGVTVPVPSNTSVGDSNDGLGGRDHTFSL